MCAVHCLTLTTCFAICVRNAGAFWHNILIAFKALVLTMRDLLLHRELRYSAQSSTWSLDILRIALVSSSRRCAAYAGKEG